MGGVHSLQADDSESYGRRREDRVLYKLVDMHGGGELITWMRHSVQYGDDSLMQGFLEYKVRLRSDHWPQVRENMYGQGQGKLMLINELVAVRNKERNDLWQRLLAKRSSGKAAPNLLDHFNQEGKNTGDVQKALKLLDGGGKRGRNESKYRKIYWKLEDRGSMGETLMGVCLLTLSKLHRALTIRLAHEFPHLVNDYCISEDYYGMSPLHQAIINEDAHMVSILLKNGANVQARCYGAFFCAEDQKSHRADLPDTECVDLPLKTSYTGRMYFGEYPLSFAACMNDEDCFRLLIAYKANPNAQDCNGNTVLHMCVIHENLRMLRLAVSSGAKLNVLNRQQLTPLTLAAELAKREMFVEILGMEADVVWSFADASQDTTAHLDLLDGLLESIIESKWQAFGKRRWIMSFIGFCVYYLAIVTAFALRPISMTTEAITDHAVCESGLPASQIWRWEQIDSQGHWNRTLALLGEADTFRIGCPRTFPGTTVFCHLRDYEHMSQRYPGYGYIRLVCELYVVISVVVQLALDGLEIQRIGRAKWLTILVIYKISFVFVLLVIPVRALCFLGPTSLMLDNYLSVLVITCTTVHFLFYCRALKFIGPFVLMIYTIIKTDLFRFAIIYIIFLFGFSQAFYITFNSCEKKRIEQEKANLTRNSSWVDEMGIIHPKPDTFDNIISSPQEAFVRTFIMTIGEFMTLYRELSSCQDKTMMIMGKTCFLIFELLVFVLLFNLLIACLTRTYEVIFNTRKEYKRQFAQVILSLETALSPQERLIHLLKYSRPIGTNKQRRSYVVNKKLNDDNMEAYEKRAQEEKLCRINEERRFLQKKKMKDLDMRDRPFTSRPPNTPFLPSFAEHKEPAIVTYTEQAMQQGLHKAQKSLSADSL